MTRSMYLSRSRSEAMTSLAVTSCIEAFGTSVLVKALDIVTDMARNERVVSFPPVGSQGQATDLLGLCLPLRIAAFPDFMAREAMLAMTSGRASKMINKTPIGHVNLSSSRPLSSLVLRVILLTVSYKSRRALSQRARGSSPSYTVVQDSCETQRTIHQPPNIKLLRRNPSPGSSRSRTSSMPCSMSSHLLFLPKSNRFSTL